MIEFGILILIMVLLLNALLAEYSTDWANEEGDRKL